MIWCPSRRFIAVSDRRSPTARRVCRFVDHRVDNEQQASCAGRAAITGVAVAAQQSVLLFFALMVTPQVVVDGQDFGVSDVRQIRRRRLVG